MDRLKQAALTTMLAKSPKFNTYVEIRINLINFWYLQIAARGAALLQEAL
jgi:hypothetical protein